VVQMTAQEHDAQKAGVIYGLLNLQPRPKKGP
jgi:hypothetical protein